MKHLLRWLRWLFTFGRRDDGPSKKVAPPTKSIETLLIYPRLTEEIGLDKSIKFGEDEYYTSSPWKLGTTEVNQAISVAEDWLANVIGRRIKWNQVRVIDSRRSLSEWRSQNIGLVKEEVELLGLPWTDDYIYLAFVRGMGGYAGGIRYENGRAGYAMVGDVCLEAVSDHPAPTAGSVLLGDKGWLSNSYSRIGQTGAFIHEALHGLDLPHPDGWPEGNQPDWDATLMGNWWNMPNFTNTAGLTALEIKRVLEWTPSPK